uniref:Transcription repressor n=1 Tax=Nelumbo nucifera TaxID=4432 RepID=A0A822YSY6_NELNU|nr:TPA_asm: hypothetical protein HUJ06_006402 [Nelumbo nucifera]
MEARLKMRISRMFRSSFGSCKPRNIIGSETSICLSLRLLRFEFFHLCADPDGRKQSETMEVAWNESITVAPKEVLQRSKVSKHGPCFVSGDMGGRTCPPASPILPLNSFYSFEEFQPKERKKRSKKTRKTHRKYKKKESFYHLSSPSAETNGGEWFSSEDELDDETETFFSSRSFSSDSSESRHLNKKSSRRRSETRAERRRAVKRSSDPYSDFRTSMVEMIIEKQIFAAKDLEQLLHCFLSLNSLHHHKVIVEVFSEIWEALFYNLS